MIAKSISIKGQGGKFGRCVAKAAVLTSGGLGRVPDSGLRRLLYHWPRIREQLLQGAYQPQPLKRVKIPKPGGGERPLGIPTVLGKLDSWLRRRLRMVFWRQWKRGRSRFAALRRLGAGRDLAAKTAGSALGPWRLSRSPALSFALPNTYFISLGLLTLAPGR